MNTIELYKCTNDIKAVLQDYFDSETERNDTLEAVIGQFEVAAQDVIAGYLNQTAITDMLEQHIKAAQEKLAARRTKEADLKARIATHMQNAGIHKIEANDGTFTASFRKSTATEIDDESQIPQAYIKQIITERIDKTAIKQAIQNGEEVPGAKLITRQNLQIK